MDNSLTKETRAVTSPEELRRYGIWVVGINDEEYPQRYKDHLKEKAPPQLYGIGDKFLLKGGGLGIVGSRNVDQASTCFTREVAEWCADNSMPVVSGGARGVDRTSMVTALENGGTVIGILPDNLLKRSHDPSIRDAIEGGRLLLLSPYDPKAHFKVGRAMGRNKLIYAMADYVVVVSAESNKGGTWAGAIEELDLKKRANPRPVFVQTGENVPQGNNDLLKLGTIPIDSSDFKRKIEDLMDQILESHDKTKPTKQYQTMFFEPDSTEMAVAEPETETLENSDSIY